MTHTLTHAVKYESDMKSINDWLFMLTTLINAMNAETENQNRRLKAR